MVHKRSAGYKRKLGKLIRIEHTSCATDTEWKVKTFEEDLSKQKVDFSKLTTQFCIENAWFVELDHHVINRERSAKITCIELSETERQSSVLKRWLQIWLGNWMTTLRLPLRPPILVSMRIKTVMVGHCDQPIGVFDSSKGIKNGRKNWFDGGTRVGCNISTV